MKRVVLLLFSLIILATNAQAAELTNELQEKKEVELINCLSSTTSWYSIDGKVVVTRLLAFDSEDGDLNQEIDDYTCNLLENAEKIEIEYDAKATEKDRYNRDLVWVYVDGELLQDILIKKGYGQVNYVNSEYQYLSNLCETQKEAITDKLGIWNYSNIKEEYCKSGIDISNVNSKEEVIEEEIKKYDVRTLRYILLINSGITLLVLLLLKRRGKING